MVSQPSHDAVETIFLLCTGKLSTVNPSVIMFSDSIQMGTTGQ